MLAATASAAEKNELINSAAIERDLLAGRLAALETKLESLVGTISLKDQQIVALQKQLKTLESAPKVLPEQGFLTPMSIAFMVTLVILVVVLLLMSARYQRLTRSLRAAPASVVGAELQDSSPALTATTGSRLDSAVAGTNPSVETLATASVASAAGDAEPVVIPAEPEDLSAATPAQVEADVSELDLSALDGLDDLSELETLEDIEALDGLETLEELEDLSELETLDLSDAGDMSETDVASELAVDPDEDPANMLDLARAYVEMGDSDAARSLLNRVAVIGTSSEATEAQKMLLSLSED